MNPLNQFKATSPLLIALALLGFALLPKAQAVVPPPDGGYPNFTTAEGTNALQSLTTGAANTAVGWDSLFSNTDGSFSTATGAGTLLFNNGDENTAVGAVALLNNTTGSNNTAVGAAALLNNTTGSLNTALGFAAGIGVTTANDVICIGAPGADVSNSCYIANIFAQQVDPTSAPVIVDNQGKLGIVVSSRRFKHDIKPMAKSSEVILALKPVTFHYRSDTKDTPQFGLLAEEVAEVNPDLVVRDKNGEIYTVRYEAVNAMLLNEFLKEHRKNEEQEATIARQQKQIGSLTAGLQKVSTQLEASKSGPKIVLNKN